MDSLQIIISAILADPTLKDIKTQLDVIKKEYGNLTINLNIDKQAIAALTTIANSINKATLATIEQAKATNTVTEAIKNEKKATDEATASQIKYNVEKQKTVTGADYTTTSNTKGNKFNNTTVSQTKNADGEIIDHPIVRNIDTAGQVRAQAAEQLAIEKKALSDEIALEKEYQSYLKADLDAQETAKKLSDAKLLAGQKKTIAAKKVADKEYTQSLAAELNAQEQMDNVLRDIENKRIATDRQMITSQQSAEYKAKEANYEASLKQELALQKEYDSYVKADLDAQVAAQKLSDSIILEDQNKTLAAKKIADKEYTQFWNTELKAQDDLDKKHYLALQENQKINLAKMKEQQALTDKERIAQQDAEQKAQAAQMQKGSARQSITGVGGLSVANMALSIGLFTTLNGLYQTMVQGMKDVEDGAAGLQQVFEKQITSTGQLNKVTDDFVAIAQKYGTSVNDVLAGAKQWGRQYKDVESAMTLTNSSTLLSVVDNVSLADSNRGLEATMNSLGMAAKTQTEAFANSMKIVDSWSALAHQASVSATDLVHATENSAGAAKAAGVSFDQLQALATAGVRNTGLAGANVGNMLKSVFASINSDKAEKALDSVGIKLKQVGSNGKEEFRPVFDVLLQLSQYLQTSDKDNQKLLETISGGKYQWSKVSSLLSDYNTILDANAISVNSAGKAAEYAQVQMNTLSRDVTRLKDTFIEIAAQTDQNGLGKFLKGVVDGLTSLILGLEKLPAGFDLTLVGIGGLLVAFKALNSVMTTLEPLAKVLIVSYQGMTAKQVEATVATEAQIVATEAQTVAMEGEVLASAEVIATTEATIVALEGETVAATETAAAFTTLDIVSGGLAIIIGVVVTALAMTAIASGKASTATLAHNEAIKEQVGLSKQALDVANQKMAFMDTAIKQETELKKALEDTNLTHEQRAKLMKDQIDLYHAVGTATDNDKLKTVDASNVKNQSLLTERTAISKLVDAKKTAYEDTVKTNSKVVQDDLDATNQKIDDINKVIDALKNETLAKMSEMSFSDKVAFGMMKTLGFLNKITGNTTQAQASDDLATQVKRNAHDQLLDDANKKYDNLKAQKAKDEYTIAGGNLDLANIDLSNDSPMGVPDPPAGGGGSTTPVDQTFTKYTVKNRELDSQLVESQAAMDKLKNTTQEYRDELEKQIPIYQQKQVLAHQEADDLRAEEVALQHRLDTEKLTISQQNTLKNQIDSNQTKVAGLSKSWADYDKTISDISNKNSLSLVSEAIDKSAESTKEFDEKIKNLKTSISSLKTDPADKIKDQGELINLYGDEQDKIIKTVAALQAQEKGLDTNSEAWKKLNDEIGKNKDSYNQLDADAVSLREKMATEIVDTMKKGIQEQQKSELFIEDERHKNKIKNLDDEYNKQITDLDRAQQAADASKVVEKDTNDALKLQREIDAHSMDTSSSGQSQVIDDKQKLATLQEKIADEQAKRQTEIVKQGLQDQNKIAKDLETKQNDSTVDGINEKYDKILNNDTYWLGLEKKLIDGHITEVNTQMEGLITSLGKFATDNASVIGAHVSSVQTMINQLKAANAEVAQIGTNPNNKVGTGTTGNTTNSTGQTLTWQESLAKAGLDDTYAASELARAQSVYNADKAKGDMVGANAAHDYAEQLRKTNSSLPKYITGGLNKSSGIAQLDGTASRPELVLNSIDTSNILKVVDFTRDIMSRIKTPDFSKLIPKMNGDASGNFTLNLGGVTINGTPQGAQNALDIITNGVKQLGINIRR